MSRPSCAACGVIIATRFSRPPRGASRGPPASCVRPTERTTTMTREERDDDNEERQRQESGAAGRALGGRVRDRYAGQRGCRRGAPRRRGGRASERGEHPRAGAGAVVGGVSPRDDGERRGFVAAGAGRVPALRVLGSEEGAAWLHGWNRRGAPGCHPPRRWTIFGHSHGAAAGSPADSAKAVSHDRACLPLSDPRRGLQGRRRGVAHASGARVFALAIGRVAGAAAMAHTGWQSQRPPAVPPAPSGVPIPLDRACPPRADGAPAILEAPLDHWIVPPNTEPRRKRGRGPGRRTGSMAQSLGDLVEQFCVFQRKQRGKTEGGVKTYRWNLMQYLLFLRGRRGRPACLGDLEPVTIQAWMDSMAEADLAVSTMRVRQSTLSSLCAWLVKRGYLEINPIARLDRPPHRREAPCQVPGSAIMDALIKAALKRQRPRDVAIFLTLRFSGMRRESVATRSGSATSIGGGGSVMFR